MRRRDLLRYAAVGFGGLYLPRRRKARLRVLPGQLRWSGSVVNLTKLVVGAVPTFAEVVAQAGIRGPYGPQTSSANLPGYPGSFDGTIGSGGTYASISDAATNGPSPGVFRILAGTYTSPTTATVKADQQFWGDPGGVTLTYAAGTTSAFTDGGTAKANVKIMNITFIGFRDAIRCDKSGGWEIGYLDMSAGNDVSGTSACINVGGQTVTPGTYIHHSRLHNSINPVQIYQTTSGIRIEDCEVDHIILSAGGAWKVAVGSTGVIVRHCWLHDTPTTDGTSAGVWFDFWNFGCLVEWCRIENNLRGGIMWEANPGPYGTDPSGVGAGNICRYNYIANNGHVGLIVHGSAGMGIYGNYLYRNQPLAQTGLEDAEMQFYVNSHMVGPRGNATNDQASDLSHNNVHGNYIEVTPTIAGHQPKRGAVLRVDTGAELTDTTPWLNNSKLNTWSSNEYKFNRALTELDIMKWVGTNKTWAQWQALPQDTDSTAGE